MLEQELQVCTSRSLPTKDRECSTKLKESLNSSFNLAREVFDLVEEYGLSPNSIQLIRGAWAPTRLEELTMWKVSTLVKEVEDLKDSYLGQRALVIGPVKGSYEHRPIPRTFVLVEELRPSLLGSNQSGQVVISFDLR